jgi:hypothetical protein
MHMGDAFGGRRPIRTRPPRRPGLHQVLAIAKWPNAIEQLDLTFSVMIKRFGQRVMVPLCIDDMQAFLQGDIEVADIKEVTGENATEYISEYIEWFAHRSVQRQFEAFFRGFRRLFTRESIKCFNEEELDVIVSGEESFDWTKVRKRAKYQNGYSNDHIMIRWFWEVFEELNETDRVKFIQFTTGSPRTPVGGFVITLERTADPTKLPVSHTCFHTFAFPEYRSKVVLKRKIALALSLTEGFGLV